jgi:hypothetical protein
MKLSAPKQITWWIAVILAIVAVVFTWIITTLTVFTGWQFVVLLVGFVILALGTFVKGL